MHDGFIRHLTLSSMAGFQTHISKCSERGVKLNFMIFFIGASATKRFARSRIRYGLPQDILSKRQKAREGGGAYNDPRALKR